MRSPAVSRNAAQMIAVAAVLALLPVAGIASPMTAQSILGQFNLVTSGDVSTSQDIEGSAVIGGNLGGSGTFFNNRVPVNPSVYFYGTNTGNSNIDAGGRVDYGANTGHFNLNGGATATQGGFPNLLADYVAPLTALSSQLATMSANSTVAVGANSITFNAVADANGIAVFDFTAAALQSDLRSTIQFNRGAGVKSIIINVDGSFAEPGGINWNPPPQQDVLFNFYDATTVTVGQWEGSLLAPNASVGISSGALEGSVFAKTFTGGGELHDLTFNGTLPSPPPSSSPVLPVPEPASLLLLGVGAAALWRARRHG